MYYSAVKVCQTLWYHIIVSARNSSKLRALKSMIGMTEKKSNPQILVAIPIIYFFVKRFNFSCVKIIISYIVW